MPAFLVADIEVTDKKTYRKYREANPDIVNKFGGRYIALGGDTVVLEGDWQPNRTIIIEFSSMDTLKSFYSSAEYVELRKLRLKSANSRLIAIETLPEPVERP